ncbi:hypothetical protein AB3M93_11460 [Novosphingobium panipatense]|uniref:hypothetical protein n=1 Tax=Novosphingobium panipatense TaxID=428991 RepID=UPI0039A0F7DF
MADRAEVDRAEESEAVKALRSEAWETFGHDEFVDQLLGLPYGKAGERHDRSITLNSILAILSRFCGTTEAGCRWLFRPSAYSSAAEGLPYYSLDNSEYWPMEVMLDWLRVIEKIQTDRGLSFPELFTSE